MEKAPIFRADEAKYFFNEEPTEEGDQDGADDDEDLSGDVGV